MCAASCPIQLLVLAQLADYSSVGFDRDSVATSVLLSSVELFIQMQIQVKHFLALQLKCAATQTIGTVLLLPTVAAVQ